jgi:DNA repair protein SbcC/Rad50
LLENITAGLYEAGDMRRLENASPGLARIKRESSLAEPALAEAIRRLTICSAEVANVSNHVKRQVESLVDPLPGENWDLNGMKKRCDALFVHSVSEDIARLQEKQGRINRIAGFLAQSSAGPDAVARTQQQELLGKQTARRDELEKQLIDGLKFNLENFPQLATVFRSFPENAPISRRIIAAKTTCESITTEFGDDTKLKNEIERECATLQETIESLKTRLKEVEGSPGSPNVESARRQFELLRSVIENIHGQDCPVCGRDFSETESGSLAGKVRLEIERLGLDIQKTELAMKQRNEISESLNATVRRLDGATGRQKEIEQRLSRLAGAHQEAQAISAFITDNEHKLDELKELTNNVTVTQEKLRNLDIRNAQTQEGAKESRALADEIQINESDRPTELSALVRFLSGEIQRRLQVLEQRRGVEQELKTQISKAETAYRDLAKTQKEISDNRQTLATISVKREQINDHVRMARHLSQAAATAKTNLLNQVFNETLNSLWKSLYRRLARREDFVPQLSEPSLNRGKIETHITGTMDGIIPFENFAAVSSLGNLNTAALSLFLALNLVETPKHHILLLDDPVQNMDDMHVIQFASLLRSIAFQAKRQIVLAVHEKALFDYLALELGPTRDGDSLNLVTITREDGSEASRVEVERRSWKADVLRFGT